MRQALTGVTRGAAAAAGRGAAGAGGVQHSAEYDGGVVTFDQCTIDSKSKLGEVSNVIDCTFV